MLIMRKINRTISSALIWSKDWKLLMWKKDPKKWWVYNDCWHIPGGGIDEWESLINAVVREVKEEVWLDILDCIIKELPNRGQWKTEKTLETWEIVMCEMEFNRFEVIIDKNAKDICVVLWDDLVEYKWFDKEKLGDVKQIPGWKEFFKEIWYISE